MWQELTFLIIYVVFVYWRSCCGPVCWNRLFCTAISRQIYRPTNYTTYWISSNHFNLFIEQAYTQESILSFSRMYTLEYLCLVFQSDKINHTYRTLKFDFQIFKNYKYFSIDLYQMSNTCVKFTPKQITCLPASGILPVLKVGNLLSRPKNM